VCGGGQADEDEKTAEMQSREKGLWAWLLPVVIEGVQGCVGSVGDAKMWESQGQIYSGQKYCSLVARGHLEDGYPGTEVMVTDWDYEAMAH
jgi:hypothetical protein